MPKNDPSQNKAAGSVDTFDTDLSWSASELSSVSSNALEEGDIHAQDTASSSGLETGSIVSVLSVRAETISDYEERLREYLNQLPGGLLKTSVFRFLALSASASFFDGFYNVVVKVGFGFQSTEVALQNSGDMALSSTLGALLLVSLLTGSKLVDSQLTPKEEAWWLSIFTQMINNLLGAGLRLALIKETHDSMRVGLGEAVYGVLLGEFFTVAAAIVALIVAISVAFSVFVLMTVGCCMVEAVMPSISPPSELNAAALQSLGQASQIAGFTAAHSDIELAIIPERNHTMYNATE